jgi:ABC-type multidrug transport system permease subunit
MPNYLQWVANFMPLTYAVGGLREIMLNGDTLGGIPKELGVLLAFTAAMSVGAAFTLRRR